MAELPSEIMYDIFSRRMPVKSLAGFRCVSKLWRNYINDPYFEIMHAKQAAVDDPMLIVFHQLPSHHSNSPCVLSFLEYKEEAGSLEARKKPPVMEFMCYSYSCCCSCTYHADHIVIGSCNGLLYSSKGHPYDNTGLVVIHPLRKECYELPPINRSLIHPPFRICMNESFGLGFDESTMTFKMVSVLNIKQVRSPNSDQLWEDLCTMVHVLGTDSWRKIPQVPSYHISGEGVFANGCLHWLKRDNDEYPMYQGRPVISFDMASEEFGLINPPQESPSGWIKEKLVDLRGEVGYVYHIVNIRIEVWVLKERVWVMHCRFEQKPPLRFPCYLIKIFGLWNENGDVLMTDDLKRMFVYKLNSDSLYEVSFVGWDGNPPTDIRMYQSSLFTTRYSIKN